MNPGLNLYYQYNLSKNGKIYKKSRKRKCHSFVVAFIQNLGGMLGSAKNTFIDTGNTSRTEYHLNDFKTSANSGVAYLGSVVGTGNAAVTINDYKLATAIAHGSGAGQLLYSACTVAIPSFTDTTGTLIVSRLFTNSSGGTITVEEIGIYCKDSVPYYYLIARDLSTIVVTDGTILTLNYIIQTTL